MTRHPSGISDIRAKPRCARNGLTTNLFGHEKRESPPERGNNIEIRMKLEFHAAPG